MISSRNNPRVKFLSSLKKSKERRESGLAIAEGVHLVVDALASDIVVESVLLAEGFLVHPEYEKLLSLFTKCGVKTELFSHSCYEKFSDLKSPEGVAVLYSIEEYDTAEVFGCQCRLVVADGIQEPGNAGAIVRAAEAAGASGIAFVGGVDLTNSRFVRAAMGSSFRIPCRSFFYREISRNLRDENITCIACASAAALRDAGITDVKLDCYDKIEYESPVAIIIGGEGQGVSPAMLAVCSKFVYIPMTGMVESLNAAVAAGLIMYQAWGGERG